ncbi:VanZ family protein [Paenibacillus sp. Marseille-P2973]|nr:VanZ family protein [Paenibacillus sp. Marseille-P2973]
MFESYLFPIAYAFMAFPVAALFFTLPFLVVQYRRHGYINKVRAFVLYLFLLYLMNAVFLVMLPLPATRHNLPLSAGTMQLVPFNFIQDILRETSVVKGVPSTYLHLLKERAVLQVLFNVLLTVPFGMLVRYYFRIGPLRCLLLSFLLSLFFEVTQLTGIYGLYDHAYRVFDLDDLMTNTLGGMIGFLAAVWLSGLLPRIEHLDKGVDLSTKRVSYTRRGLAFMFDFAICIILMTICYTLRIPGAYFVSTGLYFILLPYLTGGCTFGKWLVRIRLIRSAGTSTESKAERWSGMDRAMGGSGANSVPGAGRGLGADRASRVDGVLGADGALRVNSANSADSALRADGALGANKVLRADGALGADKALKADGVLGADGVLRENSADGAEGAFRADSSIDADRALSTQKALRADSSRGAIGTPNASSAAGSVSGTKQISNVREAGDPTRITLFALILRNGMLYWVLFGLNRMMAFSSSEFPGISRFLLGMLVLTIDLWFFIHLVKHLFQKDPQLFYEKISKTQHKIMWKPSTDIHGEKA